MSKTPNGQEDKIMENMKLLKLEDLENICGGFRRYGPVLPGMGFHKFPDKKEDEPKDGGATGSW